MRRAVAARGYRRLLGAQFNVGDDSDRLLNINDRSPPNFLIM
jgi:hypothetical protein